MVSAPAFFVLGLGVHARMFSSHYDIVRDDPHSEAEILAYVPYLRQSKAFVARDPHATVAEARRVAEAWVSGAGKGDLKPLSPVAFEDTSSDGAKSQIFDTKSQIATRLINGIGESARSGNTRRAVQDAVLVVKLADILKYSDFISLFNCAGEQRRALHQIEAMSSKLSLADCQVIADALPDTKPQPARIDRMVRRSKQMFLTWRERRGYEPLSIEDTQLLSEIPALVRNDNAVALREMRDRIYASKDDHVPTYCSSVRLGVGAQELLNQDITKVTELIAKRRSSPASK